MCIQIACEDGVPLAATVFRPECADAGGIVVICSALGVPRIFYRPFAGFLCDHHFCVITFDYRGTGRSNPAVAPNRDLNLADWGRQDIDAVIRHAFALSGSDCIFLVGHSIGGQVFFLAPRADRLKGVILVGSSFTHWSRWSFPRNLLMAFFFYVLVPVLGIGRKEFPLKWLGLSKENMAVSLIVSWAGWARSRQYVTDKKFNIDTTHLGTLAVPVLSFGFDDDTYAPLKAIRRYHEALESAIIDERYIRTDDCCPGGVGHFGFFRKTGQDHFWPEVAAWLATVKNSDINKRKA